MNDVTSHAAAAQSSRTAMYIVAHRAQTAGKKKTDLFHPWFPKHDGWFKRQYI